MRKYNLYIGNVCICTAISRAKMHIIFGTHTHIALLQFLDLHDIELRRIHP